MHYLGPGSVNCRQGLRNLRANQPNAQHRKRIRVYVEYLRPGLSPGVESKIRRHTDDLGRPNCAGGWICAPATAIPGHDLANRLGGRTKAQFAHPRFINDDRWVPCRFPLDEAAIITMIVIEKAPC